MPFGFILFCLQLFICQIATPLQPKHCIEASFFIFWGIFYAGDAREFSKNVYLYRPKC